MGKESIVDIKGHQYRYVYEEESGKTTYMGPVGSSPEIGEEEFTRTMMPGAKAPDISDIVGSRYLMHPKDWFQHQEDLVIFKSLSDAQTSALWDLWWAKSEFEHDYHQRTLNVLQREGLATEKYPIALTSKGVKVMESKIINNYMEYEEYKKEPFERYLLRRQISGTSKRSGRSEWGSWFTNPKLPQHPWSKGESLGWQIKEIEPKFELEMKLGGTQIFQGSYDTEVEAMVVRGNKFDEWFDEKEKERDILMSGLPPSG